MAAGQTYEQVAYTALGAPAATISFTSIASTWTDLQLVLTGVTSASTAIKMTFNSDTATNYSQRYMTGNRTSVVGASSQNNAALFIVGLAGTSSTTNPDLFIVDIMQYKNTTPYKTVLWQEAGDSGSANNEVGVYCGMWRSTSAITRIDLALNSGNFGTGFTAALYGIAAA